MNKIGFWGLVVTVWLWPAISHALTIDEIIKLKRAGLSDSTIELLIRRAGDARSAGVWQQDGWIIHSTESRFPEAPRTESYEPVYPDAVYPEVASGDRHRPK